MLLLSAPRELKEDNTSSTATYVVTKDLNFKKSLIAQVRRHQILYDFKHKNFTKVAEKEKAWQNIAIALTAEVNVCKNTWFDLRYDYQRYVRRLRKFFNSGNKNNKRRPVMTLETDMVFLWRFVANKSLYPLPTEMENNENNGNVATAKTAQPATEEDDVVMLENDPVVVIDLDDDEDSNTKQSNALLANSIPLNTHEVCRLVDLIKVFPELYNSKHHFYNDFKRKGMIWNVFANELGDKATKLMKCWLHIQTRYEWELKHLQDSSNSTKTEIQKLLEFLSLHMDCNPNTIYKHSFYLKQNWGEPIEDFENILNLLEAIKKVPQIVTLTDDLLYEEMKNDQYFQLWNDVAKMKGTTIAVCETTWLILRSLYWQLMGMHEHRYQLRDEWYFESIITELYALAETAKTKASSVGLSVTETPIVVNLDEDENISSKIETKINSTTSTYTNVFVNEQVKIPKILSVKSLASSQINVIKTYSGPGLQITPITSPIAAAAAFNGVVAQSSLNSSLSFSSIALNKNILPINLPYQLPHNTKVTAFTPSATAAVSTATTFATNNTTIKPIDATINLNAETQTLLTTPKPMGGPIYKPILPKITRKVSIINPNEITVKWIASPEGKQLVVHDTLFAEKHSISVGKAAKFIREVMAIPVLHNKLINQQAQVDGYWHYLSKRFYLPVNICRGLWNYLSKNFNLFSQIAPMDDLMKPFKIGIEVWTESHQLFDSFHEMAVLEGYRSYKQQLPGLMQQIGLYFAISKQKLSISCYESYIHWPSVELKFPTIDKCKIVEMWITFRKVFWQYMCELERGIDNKWPQEWWKVLAKMDFLMVLRYHNQEPFYYIVRNKIIDEIKRCNLYEMKTNNKIEKVENVQQLKALNTGTGKLPATNNKGFDLHNSPHSLLYQHLNRQYNLNAEALLLAKNPPSSDKNAADCGRLREIIITVTTPADRSLKTTASMADSCESEALNIKRASGAQRQREFRARRAAEEAAYAQSTINVPVSRESPKSMTSTISLAEPSESPKELLQNQGSNIISPDHLTILPTTISTRDSCENEVSKRKIGARARRQNAIERRTAEVAPSTLDIPDSRDSPKSMTDWFNEALRQKRAAATKRQRKLRARKAAIAAANATISLAELSELLLSQDSNVIPPDHSTIPPTTISTRDSCENEVSKRKKGARARRQNKARGQKAAEVVSNAPSTLNIPEARGNPKSMTDPYINEALRRKRAAAAERQRKFRAQRAALMATSSLTEPDSYENGILKRTRAEWVRRQKKCRERRAAKRRSTEAQRQREYKARRAFSASANATDINVMEEVTYTSPNILPTTTLPQSSTLKLHNRPDIDAYTLILAIRRHPQIYQRSRSADRVKAWRDVAVELKTSISSCRLAFQRAVRNYRNYVARDPTNRCRFNQRYFKHLSKIYRVVKSTPKLHITTPTELNQSSDLELTESNEINFPERFILDINMDTAKPALVMKNWAFAIRNILQNTDQVFEDKLRQLFSKFLPHANL